MVGGNWERRLTPAPRPNPCPRLCPQEQNSELQAKYQKLLVRTGREGLGQEVCAVQTVEGGEVGGDVTQGPCLRGAPACPELMENPNRSHLLIGVSPVLQFASCFFIKHLLCAKYGATYFSSKSSLFSKPFRDEFF